jgi:type II secretory pathway pseudopilin PulG
MSPQRPSVPARGRRSAEAQQQQANAMQLQQQEYAGLSQCWNRRLH